MFEVCQGSIPFFEFGARRKIRLNLEDSGDRLGGVGMPKLSFGLQY
jgi:hypothetical protein